MSNMVLNNCNFIHIPKCGGTYINTVLWRLGCVRDKARHITGKPGYGHLFPAQMPTNGNAFFTFVRHPVTWWQSFYQWNINDAHSRFSDLEKRTESFDEWLNDYGEFWLGFYSHLVRRYTGADTVKPTNNLVTLVGKTENLKEDLKNILDIVGEPYCKNAMARFMSDSLDMKDEHRNIQAYDRKAVSDSSRRDILKAESYVLNTFGY